MRHGTSSTARALGVVGLALALAPLAATASFADTRQTKPIEVLGTADNKFVPVDVTTAPDAKGNVTISLKSEGAPHTYTNTELGFDSGIVNAGDTKKFTFKAPPPGKHRVVCTLHEAQGMVGTLTITEKGGAAAPDKSPSAAPSSQAPSSAGASASVGAPQGGDNAPTDGDHEGEEDAHAIPGVEGNEQLERIEFARKSQQGAVSGFKFFTMVCVAFLFILGAAILFSTRPRRVNAR